MKLHQSARSITLLLGAGIFLAGCNHGQQPAAPVAPPAAAVREISSPAGANSAQPNLAAGPDGAIYLSWIETSDSGTPALKFAMRNGENWSPAQTIVASDNLMVNYADFPSLLALSNGVLAAHWLASIPNADDGYNVEVAFSRDGGKTWSKPVIPYRDRSRTEHGFVSMTSTPDGGLGTIWLDSRKLAKSGENGDVAMMYTSVNPDGKLGPETTIDGRVCECCQPSSVRTANGILTVYRQRSPQEIRDIGIVRFDGKQWSKTTTVFPDMWHINACPINGPAIDAHGNDAAVAWFTAANNKPKVELAFSSDGGATFAAPIQVDEGSPIGRVGVVALDSGSAVVTWLEKIDNASQLRMRQIDKDGTKRPSLLVGNTSAGAMAGFPRIERQGDAVLVAWTDTNASKVRVSALETNK